MRHALGHDLFLVSSENVVNALPVLVSGANYYKPLDCVRGGPHGVGVTAAEIVKTWAIDPKRNVQEVATARSYLSQMPMPPRLPHKERMTVTDSLTHHYLIVHPDGRTSGPFNSNQGAEHTLREHVEHGGQGKIVDEWFGLCYQCSREIRFKAGQFRCPCSMVYIRQPTV